MKLRILLLITCVLAVGLLICIEILNSKMKEQDELISDLQDQNEALLKKVRKLEDEKEELEDNLSDLSSTQVLSESMIEANRGSLGGISNGMAVVVYRREGCDYFIMENASGYIIAEWMGGNDPNVGDKVSGNFNSFGSREFYNQSSDDECRLWIDDFMLSKSSAIENLGEKCE